jgi:hypothetical protein
MVCILTHFWLTFVPKWGILKILGDYRYISIIKPQIKKNSVSNCKHYARRYSALLYPTLHYATLHYATLHYATLRDATRRYATLRYSTLLYATLHYYMLLDATLRYSTLLYATLRKLYAFKKARKIKWSDWSLKKNLKDQMEDQIIKKIMILDKDHSKFDLKS